MKKIAATLVIVGLILFFGWQIWVRNFESTAGEVVASSDRAGAPLTVASLRSQAIAREELRQQNADSAAATETTNQVPVQCQTQWDKIATTSYDQLEADLTSGVLEVDQNCVQFESENPKVRSFYSQCAYDRRAHQLVKPQECLEALVSYRVHWVDRLTQDRTDYMAMPLPILMNKILARFHNQNPTQDEKLQAIEMTEALVQREPDFYAARKALVGTLLTAGDNPENLTRAYEAATTAREMNPEDPEMLEVQLAMGQMRGEGPERINEFISANPNNSLAHYYRAAMSMKSGAKDAAIADLKRAIELNPKDDRFQRSLDKIQSGSNKNNFELRIGFSFDNL